MERDEEDDIEIGEEVEVIAEDVASEGDPAFIVIVSGYLSPESRLRVEKLTKALVGDAFGAALDFYLEDARGFHNLALGYNEGPLDMPRFSFRRGKSWLDPERAGETENQRKRRERQEQKAEMERIKLRYVNRPIKKGGRR